MKMAIPDGTVLAKGLSTSTAATISTSPDAVFRTQLVRATLRIDQQPSLEDVVKYQKHLQAEVEMILSSSLQGSGAPSVKAMSVATTTKPVCKYFLKQAGCRRGAKCTFQQEMSGLR